ncbi:MAG TPA: hypothetical protein VN923_05155 [Thermoanaerobaculia bacterium]|nr:hypothetical protein [Thermoanaerobaculia bacterium]
MRRQVIALFAIALAARFLFLHATPDAAWAGSALYKGDAALWLDWADAIEQGRVFELGLPLRPPGMAYLVAALGSGSLAAVPGLKVLWCVLGASVVALFAAAARQSFGERVGWVSGLLCAFSTGLLALSTSLNNETPYLVLVGASFLFHPALIAGRRAWLFAPWAAVHGLACLIRVEHLALVVLIGGWLAVRRWRGNAPAAAPSVKRARVARESTKPASLGAVALAAACGFLLPLVPWHLHAWRAIARFNGGDPTTGAAERQALAGVEQALSGVSWDESARRERDELPAFARPQAALFVAATVAYRGGTVVRGTDFSILDEAFGCRPRPLPVHPFVALYGPLSFALAQHPRAGAGFSRAALNEPPPLAGGAGRYPPALVAGLPPPNLALVYPPHACLLADGYRSGWRSIRADPAAAFRRAGEALRLFWAGAALGFTGRGMPLGLSGLREPVDLAVPEPRPLVTLWRLGWLALCALGVVAARERSALVPWLLLLASKLLVTVLFFGYARQGAACIPALVPLAALAIDRWLLVPAERRSALVPRRAATLLVVLGLGIEAQRALDPPVLRLDGAPISARDPFAADDHAAHGLTVVSSPSR